MKFKMAAMGFPSGWNYLGDISKEEDVKRLAENGLNSVAVWTNKFRVWADPVLSKGLEKTLINAKKYGLRYYSMLYLGTSFNFYSPVKYGLFVERNGKKTKTACPLDKTFWTECIIKEAVNIARLLKEVDGVLLELELYGGGGRYSQGCFCDQCFKGFVAQANVTAPDIPPEKRHRWLASKGLLKEYYDWLSFNVYENYKMYGEELLAVNEDLTLGFYEGGHLDSFLWYIKAAMRGLSDAGARILILDPITYSGGDIWNKVSKQKLKLSTMKAKTWYLPGLYLDAVEVGVEGIGYLCSVLLEIADGYWIWNERVNIENPQLWENLRRANATY